MNLREEVRFRRLWYDCVRRSDSLYQPLGQIILNDRVFDISRYKEDFEIQDGKEKSTATLLKVSVNGKVTKKYYVAYSICEHGKISDTWYDIPEEMFDLVCQEFILLDQRFKPDG